MNDSNIIQFKPRQPTQDAELTFTVSIYEYTDGSGFDLYATQQDATEVDLPRLAEMLHRASLHAHAEYFDETQDTDHDFAASIRLFKSGRGAVSWCDEGFETAAQLAWLRRGMIDSYYQIDTRLTLGRILWVAKEQLRRLINGPHKKEDTNART